MADNRETAENTARDQLPERAAELVERATGQPADRHGLRVAFGAAVHAAARAGSRAGHSGARAMESGARVTGRALRAARRVTVPRASQLAAQVMAMAPRIPVRDQAKLRRQFPGRSTEEIASALITGAARASAAVGGTVGAWSVLPVAPAYPAEVMAETLAVVGIEITLVAELHEIYGMPAPGSLADRMTAYVAAWAQRRGVTLAPGGVVVVAAGSPLGRRLRRRLAARAGRSALSLGPLLTGAAAGAMLNRWETRRLGEDVRADLRRRTPAV
jgi:uncharacterized protein (DUF697 family)